METGKEMAKNKLIPPFVARVISVLLSFMTVACDRNPTPNDSIGDASSKSKGNLFKSNSSSRTSDDHQRRRSAASDPKFDELSVEELQDLLVNYKSDGLQKNSKAISDVLSAMALKDPDLALTELLQLDARMASSWVASPVFKTIATHDPDKLQSWLSSADKEKLDLLGVRAIESLAVISPEHGVNACLANIRRKDMGSSLFFIIGGRDPDEALQMAERFPPDVREQLLIAAANGRGMNDPQQGLDLLLKWKVTPNSYFVNSARNLIYEACKNDPQVAMEKIKNLDPKLLQECLDSPKVIAALGSRNPETLIELLSNIALTRSNENLFSRSMDSIAGKSPERAVEWLQEFPESDVKQRLVKTAYDKWSDANPGEFSKKIGDLVGDSRQIALAALGSSWGRSDPNAALQWAHQLPSDESAVFSKEILMTAAETDPHQAMRLLRETALSQSGAVQEVNDRIASSFAQQDASFATDWARQLPDELRPSATRKIVETIVGRDPQFVVEWLNKMPPSYARNEGIRALVAEIEPADPEAANEWKNLIEGSFDRNSQ